MYVCMYVLGYCCPLLAYSTRLLLRYCTLCSRALLALSPSSIASAHFSRRQVHPQSSIHLFLSSPKKRARPEKELMKAGGRSGTSLRSVYPYLSPYDQTWSTYKLFSILPLPAPSVLYTTPQTKLAWLWCALRV